VTSGELNRRDLLKAGGAIIVAFAASGHAVGYGAVGDRAARPPLEPDQLDSFIAISRDGRCTAFFGKVDVGQGVQVAIAQIVAEELDVPLSAVDVVLGDTEKTVDQGGTSGSYAISRGGQTLRYAAAEARRILVDRAAARLRGKAADIETAAGRAWIRGSSESTVSYGELVGTGYFGTQLNWNGQLGNRLEARGQALPKDTNLYTIVGTSPKRQDIADNVFGNQAYVTDVRISDMLHARVIRPPIAGAIAVSIDTGSIAQFPNTRVVHEKGLVAVLAEREWDALRASEVLGIVWSDAPAPFPGQDQLYHYLASAPTEATGGDVDDAKAIEITLAAGRVIEATYEWPFQSHASMAGACCLANVTPDVVQIWSSTQKPHAARLGVAGLLGVPISRVRVTWMRGPGSYGRNDAGDAALEAAYLSRAVGRPVRLQYTRAQATGWDPKAPASIHRCRGVLGEDGSVSSLSILSRGFSRMDVAPAESDPRDTLVGQLLGMGKNSRAAFAVAEEPYEPSHKKLAWQTVKPFLTNASPLRTAHFRDPTGLQNNFASESFWDELAHEAGADPVEFRLRHLKEARAVAVLREAAKTFGWTPRTANPNLTHTRLRGQGIALGCRYDTVCAAAVEIEVDRATGQIKPLRWAVAHDCGLIINPANLKLVIEANIIQATSRSLLEEVLFDENNVTSVNWNSYPIADVSIVPDSIDIALIDRRDVPPGGAGEPASRPVPAALANALFDATGARLRRAPLTPARVKAALG